MAKGSASKTLITNQILETFPNAFISADGKSIRFSVSEDGENFEIAATFTVKKDIERAETTEIVMDTITSSIAEDNETPAPSAEEVSAVSKLLSAIGL